MFISFKYSPLARTDLKTQHAFLEPFTVQFTNKNPSLLEIKQILRDYIDI